MFGKIIEGGQTALDLFVRRHGLLAQNIAHLETPGYRPKDLDFQSALEAAFEPQGSGAAASALGSDGHVVTDTRTAAGRDGNAVDLDRESAKIAQNSLRYDATTRIIAHKLAALKFVVSDGGRP